MSTSITNILDSKDKIFTYNNKNWVVFINDHINYLISNSVKRILHVDDLHKYRYRPNHLFKQYGNIEPSDTWIVFLINNMSMSDGVPIYTSEVSIPSEDSINFLKDQYSAHSVVSK